MSLALIRQPFFDLIRIFDLVRKSPLVTFVVRRLISLVWVVIALAFMSFMITRLIPGDPAIAILGQDATAEQLTLVRQSLGIDRPVAEQVLTYFVGLTHLDFGQSFQFREPVRNVLAARIGPSLQLAAASLLFVMTLSVPLGILAAVLTRDSRRRLRTTTFTAVTGLIGSMPEYVSATFLAFVFAVWLRLLPVAGAAGLESLVLPVLAVTLRPIALLARIVRVETINVLGEDYVRTARSKRLPWHLIYFRHILPNVVTSALTIGGIMFAHLIGSAVIVESVFARVGLGTALVNAILARDYPVVQACILVIGVSVVVVNALVDFVLTLLDPRSLAKNV